MTVLFDRRATLQVGDRLVSGLRVAFKVGKTDQPEPNAAELQVYNLAPETRAKLQRKPIAMALSAGYGERLELLFSGDVQLAETVRTGPDWVTRIRSGDGERAFKQATFSASFKSGTSLRDVIVEVAKSTGLDIGQLKDRLSRGDWRGAYDQFSSGWAGQGNAAGELDRLLRSAGLTWSIQDGAIQAVSPREATNDGAVLLSPSTGLLGSPEHVLPEKEGGAVKLRAKSFLQPGIRPGRQVRVESAYVKGYYRVTRVLHSGDTHGQEWQSELEALPL